MSQDNIELTDLNTIKQELAKIDDNELDINNQDIVEIKDQLKNIQERVKDLESILTKLSKHIQGFRLEGNHFKFTTPTTIENLAPGKNSQDAVCYSQLKELQEFCLLLANTIVKEFKKLKKK